MSDKVYIFGCGCKYPSSNERLKEDDPRYILCPVHKEKLMFLELVCVDCNRIFIANKKAHLRKRCIQCGNAFIKRNDLKRRAERRSLRAKEENKPREIKKYCYKCGHVLSQYNKVRGVCFVCQEGAYFESRSELCLVHTAIPFQ